jgi:hypothetical protein
MMDTEHRPITRPQDTVSVARPEREPARSVVIPIPGIDGVSLLYAAEDAPLEPRQLETTIAILAHWLKQQEHALDLKIVRGALRHFNAPAALGETELAHNLFDRIQTGPVRGKALQSLLLDTIEQLDPGSDHAPQTRRGYLILRRLYVEGRHRLRIGDELGLSERQYQRELHHALVRLAELLNGKV